MAYPSPQIDQEDILLAYTSLASNGLLRRTCMRAAVTWSTWVL